MSIEMLDKPVEIVRPVYTYEEFCKNGGILQPIRAIVSYNTSIENIIGVSTDVAITHDRIANRRGTEEQLKNDKHVWRNYINQSNIIGYFAAEKANNGVVIGFSYCKPEDWEKFQTRIAKQIAINKFTNKVWCVNNDGEKGINAHAFIANKKVITKEFDFHVYRNGDIVNYILLGSFQAQLNHFFKRVKKYYKLEEK